MQNPLISYLLSVSLMNCCMSSAIADTTAESIKRQMDLTSIKKFSNNVTLVQRMIPNSEITHFEVNFVSGQADLPETSKALNSITFDTLSMGSAKFSKEQIFALAEKNSIGIQCSGGIESSNCQFETVVENYDKAFEILTSITLTPLFKESDIALMRERRMANYQQDMQNPESYVNTLVNSIFYPLNHPYRHLPKDGIEQLKSFKQKDLANYYSKVLSTDSIIAVYVGPKLKAPQLKRMEDFLGGLQKRKPSARVVAAPLYNPAETFTFEHRPIPTAYIRAKFNAPGATSQDAAVSRVLFEIISEELHEEIRTKRSLSYAIFGTTLQLDQGIGIVHASTSKPRETIEVIAEVLKKIRDTTYTPVKIAEFKNVFTTSHYLAMETHDSFAGSLAASEMYFGDANKLYELPSKINAVTAQDVQRLAKDVLKKLRVGVVYDKDKFTPAWVDPLTKL